MSEQSTSIPRMLTEFHETPQEGHLGYYLTYAQQFVKACNILQRQKYLAASQGFTTQPLGNPKQVWEEITMPFITGLPISKGC